MACHGNNATPPSPGIAPGGDTIDPAEVARGLVKRFGPGGIDPCVREHIPAFDAPFYQAGLAGYSDAAMRIIARRHGCPLCVTEALLDRTLLAGGRGFAKADLGDLHDNIPGGGDDHPLVCQIMGSDPREMAAAALKAVEQRARGDRNYRELAYAGRDAAFARDVDSTRHQHPDGERAAARFEAPEASVLPDDGFAAIDVNFACPVKKISRKARGGHWLAEPDGAIAILEAVRGALPSDLPVTVKLRRSFDDTPEMADAFERIFNAAYEIGCAWVTVHGRTVEQKYVGPSRWDLLRAIRERHPDKIFFGSGDIWSAEDIFRMIGYCGVTGVSVARGCIGNPWIFRQARELLAGREPSPPTIAEQRAVLEQHFDLLLQVNHGMRNAEHATSRAMRKFGIRFAAHHPRGEEVRLRIIAVSTTDDWAAVLDEFYAEEVAR